MIGKTLPQTFRSTERVAQNVLRYNVVIDGRFFNKGSWVSKESRKHTEESNEDEQEGLLKEL